MKDLVEGTAHRISMAVRLEDVNVGHTFVPGEKSCRT